MQPLTNEAASEAGTRESNIIIVNLNVPHGAVLATVAAVAKDFPAAKWVVMSVEHRQQSRAGELSGKLCCLLPHLPSAQIVEELRNYLQGDAPDEVVSPSALLNGTSFVDHAAGSRWPGVRLTRCETRILQMLTKGLSNKEIAQRLSLSPYTVKNHVHHILDKLNVRNRIEAAMILMGSGTST